MKVTAEKNSKTRVPKSEEDEEKSDSPSTSVDVSVDSSSNLERKSSRAKWRQKQLETFSRVPLLDSTVKEDDVGVKQEEELVSRQMVREKHVEKMKGEFAY